MPETDGMRKNFEAPPMFNIETMKPESKGERHGSQEASKKSGKKGCEEESEEG
jgi:hypothetical protein